MTQRDYWLAVSLFYEETDWRYGQTAFNVLDKVRPDLSYKIRGTAYDPFYCRAEDDTWIMFCNFLDENWE